jgi:hypothetical protein
MSESRVDVVPKCLPTGRAQMHHWAVTPYDRRMRSVSGLGMTSTAFEDLFRVARLEWVDACIEAFEEDERPTAREEMSEGEHEEMRDFTRNIAEWKRQNGQEGEK